MPSTRSLGRQEQLFDDAATGHRALPVLGEQKDIRYYGVRAASILNSPEQTGMGFWSINPYIGCAFGCAYCYARYAHGYAFERAGAAHPEHAGLATDLENSPPWLAFERRILVKENAPALLRRTLRSGSDRYAALAAGDSIAIGTATDPYQPAERRYRLTRGILEALADHPGLRIGITTKSPLVTRDIDVLTRIRRHSSVHVNVSLITVDRDLARRIEPRAPTPESRLRAIRRLREHGIEAGVFVMPVLPGITDAAAELEALVAAVADAGATSIAAGALRLQTTARKRYLPFIEDEFPELTARYRSTYASSSNATDRYREGLSAAMRRLCVRYGIAYGHRQGDDHPAEATDPAEQLELPLQTPAD